MLKSQKLRVLSVKMGNNKINICKELKNNEIRLKKMSIYLLKEDLNDRDFEFFIFIDPDNPNYGNPFLNELFNAINKNTNFLYPEHKEELIAWLDTKSNDSALTPLNWVKIAIERYPYRVIVVTNRKLPSIPEFIRKRVCFLEKKEFIKIYKKNDFIFDLYSIWIRHLLKNTNFPLETFILYFKEDNEPVSLNRYIPETVPNIFDLNADKGEPYNNKIIIKISFNTNKIEYLDTLSCDENCKCLFFSRHDSFYFLDNNNKVSCLCSDLDPKIEDRFIYAEAYSGQLSYYNQLINATENIGDYKSKLFMLKYIENTLLLIGICDERFQEWWASKGNNEEARLFQMGLMPLYIDNVNKYGQYDLKNGSFYGVLNINRKKNVIDIKFPKIKGQKSNKVENKKLRKLWLQKRKDIDILIIHQAILADWQKGRQNSPGLTRKILELKNKIPFIVVTSGRGKPDNLPNGVKFLSLSNLENCKVNDYFEKITLLRPILKSFMEGKKK